MFAAYLVKIEKVAHFNVLLSSNKRSHCRIGFSTKNLLNSWQICREMMNSYYKRLMINSQTWIKRYHSEGFSNVQAVWSGKMNLSNGYNLLDMAEYVQSRSTEMPYSE